MEKGKTVQKISELKAVFFEKINKISKSLVRLRKSKRDKL